MRECVLCNLDWISINKIFWPLYEIYVTLWTDWALIVPKDSYVGCHTTLSIHHICTGIFLVEAWSYFDYQFSSMPGKFKCNTLAISSEHDFNSTLHLLDIHQFKFIELHGEVKMSYAMGPTYLTKYISSILV